MQASTIVSVRRASTSMKQAAVSALIASSVDRLTGKLRFRICGKSRRADQMHVAAGGEFADQRVRVYSRPTVACVPSTATRLLFDRAQAGLIAGTVPTKGVAKRDRN